MSSKQSGCGVGDAPVTLVVEGRKTEKSLDMVCCVNKKS
jgi:hypothetical protein